MNFIVCAQFGGHVNCDAPASDTSDLIHTKLIILCPHVFYIIHIIKFCRWSMVDVSNVPVTIMYIECKAFTLPYDI